MTYTIEKIRPKKKENEKKRLIKLQKDPMFAIFGDYQKKLVEQQKSLIGTLNSMTPILNNAKETLGSLNMEGMGEMGDMLNKLTGSFKKKAK